MPKPDLRARVGLPEIDERLKAAPRPIFRTIIIIGFFLALALVVLVLLFDH